MHLYNTLTRSLERFEPLDPTLVRMYTCGPTVYNYAHIGNFRAYVFEDVLKRHLLYRGYKVLHIMNLTDVDDKTIRGANEAGLALNDFTKPFIDAFFAASPRAHLGVQGGQLRRDIVHTWADQGDWAHLRTVFTLLQEPMAPRTLFLDEHPGMSQTRFIQWGEAWVRLSLTPGVTAQDDLVAAVNG